MEEEAIASSQDVPVTKVVDDTHNNAHLVKDIERKGWKKLSQMKLSQIKNVEETVADEEFIKVEKDSIGDRDVPNGEESRALVEAQEKTGEVELELRRVSSLLKELESKNALLKDEVSDTKEKLAGGRKKYDELGVEHKKLQARIVEEEERYKGELSALQAELQAQEMKDRKLLNMKEAFDSLNIELEISRKKMEELEQQMKASVDEARKFEELHKESGLHAESESKRAMEFEELLHLAKESAKEMEAQMASVQAETKGLNAKIADNEKLEEVLRETTSELSSVKGELDLIKSQLEVTSQQCASKEARVEELTQELELRKVSETQVKENIAELEKLLGLSSARNIELELELKNALEKCDEHEVKANTTHQRSLDLEDLMKVSHSKTEGADKKVQELEKLLGTEKHRIRELEEQVSALEKICDDADSESKKRWEMVTELQSELEAFQLKAASLEVALRASSEKESELSKALNRTTEEKRNLEISVKRSTEKLFETENLLEISRNELQQTQKRLKSFGNDLKDVSTRESEVSEKLKSVEAQLGDQRKLLEQATARSVMLESLNESSNKDAEVKLQEAVANLTSKDSEVKSLYKKIVSLEDQVKSRQRHMSAADKYSTEVKEELKQLLARLASSESANEGLTRKIIEAETKAAQTLEENEMLVETNTQLKSMLHEFDDQLSSVSAEREKYFKHLASHTITITELTEQQKRASELHLAAEARISEAEEKLHETIRELSLRDSDSKSLEDNLSALEDEIETYKGQVHEASSIAESRKGELEESLVKVKDLERTIEELLSKSDGIENEKKRFFEKKGFFEKNLKLTQELDTYQSKVSSVMEENKLLHETNQNTRNEFQKVITHLEEELKQHNINEDSFKDEIEALKAENHQISVLRNRVKELEELFTASQAQIQKETDVGSQKVLDHEAAMKHSNEDVEAKSKQLILLKNQVKDLLHKLQITEAKLNEKESIFTDVELKEDIRVASRDIGSSISSPSKRKSKKNSEPSPYQASSLDMDAKTEEIPPLMILKVILGVALISVIFGIILGKKY